MKIGVIDIGTNSCHLLVADIGRQGEIAVLDTDKIPLRLGRHLNIHGELSAEGIANTQAVVERMKEICKGYRAEVKAVATHAVRSAVNQHELIQAVQDSCGVLIDPIDGIEEARLIFLGMRFGLSLNQDSCLGIDIGGGSTEIICGTNSSIDYAASLKLGAVTMSMRFLSDEPTAYEIEELREFITTELESNIVPRSQLEFTTAIVSSGTGKALAAIDYYLRNGKTLKDANGYVLAHADLMRIMAQMEELRTPTAIERAFELDPDRAEIILAGGLILKKISKWFKIREWKISTCCLREGIVVDTYEHYSDHYNTRWQGVQAVCERFKCDQRQARRVLNFALNVLQSLPRRILPAVEIMQLRELLSAAAWLHEVGKVIGHERYHRHSYYIILHSALLGFNQREKEIIARVARHHRKSIPDKIAHLSHSDNEVIRLLAAILRIAVAGFRRRRNTILGVKISDQGILTFVFYYTDKNFPAVEMFNLRNEQNSVEKTLNTAVSFAMQRRERN